VTDLTGATHQKGAQIFGGSVDESHKGGARGGMISTRRSVGWDGRALECYHIVSAVEMVAMGTKS